MSHDRGWLITRIGVVSRPLTVRQGAHSACVSKGLFATAVTFVPHNIQFVL